MGDLRFLLAQILNFKEFPAMNSTFETEIDGIGISILRELQADARTSYSEIGRRVGLSSPAVAERVRKMEESGIIRGYHARLHPDTLGQRVTAFITLTTQSRHYPEIFALAQKRKDILECHHISGNESLIIKAASGSITGLDKLVERLGKFGETKTAIVLSSPVVKKISPLLMAD